MIKKGDKIGIIALSGECDKEKVLNAKSFFENLGYKVKLSKNIFDKNNYLAGNDEEKIKELHSLFIDKDINMILAARGGYGAIRLINKLDYDLIKNNPKPICGFSDLTALLIMIYKKTGLITYHSPMACTDFGASMTKESYTLTPSQRNFFQTLNGEITSYRAEKIYQNGQAKGILFGGNLSTAVSLCGMDFLPNEDFIFFTEDINEPVYKIDRMFQQLINIENFNKNCKGLILGDFSGSDNTKWLEDYTKELVAKLNIPTISISKITHSEDKITLPIGACASIKDDLLNFTI